MENSKIESWGAWAPAFGEAYWSCIQGCPKFPPQSGFNTHAFDQGYGAVRPGRRTIPRLLDGAIHSAFPEVTHAAHV